MNIVCLTSNGYVNCVEPFAYYWNRFAGTERGVVVAGYDVLPMNLPANFEAVSIGSQADYTWSAGLRKLLTLLGDDLVLLMLEDYFLTALVAWHKIRQIEKMMLAERKIAKFDLSDDRLKVPHRDFDGVQGVIVSTSDAPFQMSFQAAVWRAGWLHNWLDPAWNAWEAEKLGTKRVIQARRSRSCDELICGCATPPLQYANAVGGAGGKPGVIERKHMPDWMWHECVAKGWARG